MCVRITKEMNNKLTTLYIDDKIIYFSYETPVAFWDGYKLHVSQNEWSRTTGRHLNAIDGGDKEAKEDRIPHSVLMEMLSEYKLRNNIYNVEEELYGYSKCKSSTIKSGRRTTRI